MTLQIILTVVFAILTIVGSLVSYYFYIKNKITEQVAAGIDSAEIDGAKGEEKKAEVVAQLQKLIPTILKPFISTSMLDALVQMVFDKIESYAKKQVEKAKNEKEVKEDENS